MTPNYPDRTLARIRNSLLSWGTGARAVGPGDGCATIVLDSAAHIDAVVESGLVGDRTTLFLPGAVDSRVPGSVSYVGSHNEPGAELAVGDDFFLQIQDYSTSEYMSLLGPALVRITGAEDFARFLEDADNARARGVFTDFTVAPPVRIADLPGLGMGEGIDGPTLRLHVRQDGQVSTSPSGQSFGRVGTSLTDLEERWRHSNASSAAPCAVCLAAALDENERTAGIAQRPWLARYLIVLDAVRALRARGVTGTRVSGFGVRLLVRLVEVDDPADTANPALPVVLWGVDEAYVYLPSAGRTYRMPRPAAESIEALTVCGSVEAASEYAGRDEVARASALFEVADSPFGLDQHAGAGN